MNKVKVSLREIMEDDNHPLMLKWVDEFHSTLREKIQSYIMKFSGIV